MIPLEIEKLKSCVPLCSDARPNISGVSITKDRYAATNGHALIVCPGGPPHLDRDIILDLSWLKFDHELKEAFYEPDKYLLVLDYGHREERITGIEITEGKFPNINKVLKLRHPGDGDGTAPIQCFNPSLLSLYPGNPLEGIMVYWRGDNGRAPIFLKSSENSQLQWHGVIMPMMVDDDEYQRDEIIKIISGYWKAEKS